MRPSGPRAAPTVRAGSSVNHPGRRRPIPPAVPSVVPTGTEAVMATRSTTSPPSDESPGGSPRVPTAREAPEQQTPAAPPPARRRRLRLPRYTWSRAVSALLLGGTSLPPSLLPRGWLLQGLITGITAAIGCGAGVSVAWSGRELTDRTPSPAVRR